MLITNDHQLKSTPLPRFELLVIWSRRVLLPAPITVQNPGVHILDSILDTDHAATPPPPMLR